MMFLDNSETLDTVKEAYVTMTIKGKQSFIYKTTKQKILVVIFY